ncbi:hydroxycarboxylic acid receptor 2-like [Engraulis encrasicolus]|uniref:hydroxycarboxylic acid receptor 2-like n=1 Tax=Engraulis encrasicolus TaxID=184585 RepID=UPI002FD0643C
MDLNISAVATRHGDLNISAVATRHGDLNISAVVTRHGDLCVFSAPLMNRVMTPILIMEFVLGLLSNLLALWMFCYRMDTWKSHSIYLAHLTVADALVMLCLPFRADYYLRERNWVYGSAFCNVVLFMLGTCRATGITFLTAVAVDRYFKIIHTHTCCVNRLGLHLTNAICCGLWLLIVGMNVYLLTGSHLMYEGEHLQCETFTISLEFDLMHTWPDIFFVLQFLVPAAIVSFCTWRIVAHLKTNSANQRPRFRRVVCFMTTVAVVFVTCYLPSAVSRMAVWLLKAQYHHCSDFRWASVIFYYLISLTYFNSVLNPALYYFSSPAFNGMLHTLFSRLLRRTDTTITQAPGTQNTITQAPGTQNTITQAPGTQDTTTQAQVTQDSITQAQVTQDSISQAQVTTDTTTQAQMTTDNNTQAQVQNTTTQAQVTQDNTQAQVQNTTTQAQVIQNTTTQAQMTTDNDTQAQMTQNTTTLAQITQDNTAQAQVDQNTITQAPGDNR